ncbi:PAS domain-containing protein [Rhizobium sp. BG4]|uniref:PAS domain-containing protein n=1 Tax=Rhizobium sp. BG4 TaxID=2613770 RepID=UPI00193D2B99|nr:PAS domain-containing protein [Rhizobium sp. BG4]QRM45840.1 PAS domain-containing protein [Rhizobium sp. BG4]
MADTSSTPGNVDAVSAAKLVERVNGNAWAADAQGVFAYLTPAALEFFGTSLEALNSSDDGGPGWGRLVHADDYPAATDAWQRALKTGEHYNVEHRMLRSTGTYAWARCSGQPTRNEHGTITGWYGSVIDVSPPTRAEPADNVADFPSQDVLPPMDQVHPHDRPTVEQAAARAFFHGIPQISSYRQLQEDGSYRWVEFRVEPDYGVNADIDPAVARQDEPWTVASSIGTTGDAVQAALAIEKLYGGAWAIDATGQFTYATPTAQTSIAMTLVDLNVLLDGKPFLEGGRQGWQRGTHPDDSERAGETLRRALKSGEHWNFEYRVLRANGAFVWHRAAARPTFDKRGRITGWYGTALDIDVYKRTEAALRERERHLQQLVETLPGLIYCASPNGEHIYRSRRLHEYLGDDVAENSALAVPGGTFKSLIHPDDLAATEEQYARSLATGEPYSLRHRLRRFDGVYRWVENRASAMRNDSGEIIQWNGICLDVEDQIRSQEELIRAQEQLARSSQAASLAELSASIAHEVNQPLSAVVNYSSACQRWLTAEPPNIERAQRSLDRILQSANTAADVVSRIRALFKQSTDQRNSTELAAVVRLARDLVSEEAGRRSVKTVVEIENGLRPAAFDRVQIQQVLINLMRNGMDAMASVESGRLLEVRVFREREMARIEVRDQGPGVEFPDKIFEPFFTTKGQGMGMGLAISRSIVESHGGQLWAEKNEPHGACFVFTMPLDVVATS